MQPIILKTEFTVKHSSSPVKSGTAKDAKVHLILFVSLNIDRQVVEQGK